MNGWTIFYRIKFTARVVPYNKCQGATTHKSDKPYCTHEIYNKSFNDIYTLKYTHVHTHNV